MESAENRQASKKGPMEAWIIEWHRPESTPLIGDRDVVIVSPRFYEKSEVETFLRFIAIHIAYPRLLYQELSSSYRDPLQLVKVIDCGNHMFAHKVKEENDVREEGNKRNHLVAQHVSDLIVEVYEQEDSDFVTERLHFTLPNGNPETREYTCQRPRIDV